LSLPAHTLRLSYTNTKEIKSQIIGTKSNGVVYVLWVLVW